MLSTCIRECAGLFWHQSRRQIAAFKDGKQFEKNDYSMRNIRLFIYRNAH
jgi:hypothetical protein